MSKNNEELWAKARGGRRGPRCYPWHASRSSMHAQPEHSPHTYLATKYATTTVRTSFAPQNVLSLHVPHPTREHDSGMVLSCGCHHPQCGTGAQPHATSLCGSEHVGLGRIQLAYISPYLQGQTYPQKHVSEMPAQQPH